MSAMNYPEMPSGWIPIEAIAIVKCLDEDGEVRLYLNMTGITRYEALGMLRAATLTTEEDVAASFRSAADED